MDPNFVAKISIDSGMNSLKICVQILDELDIVQEPIVIVALADVPETQTFLKIATLFVLTAFKEVVVVF